MSEHPAWMVGNRNPSISETITDDAGAVVNLTGASVKFQARIVGSPTLIVDQAVSNSPLDATGFVRYDWSAADIAANGILADAHEALVWWRVTSGGKTQDLMEALISVTDHLGLSSYVELEEFKSTAQLSGNTYADGDIRLGLVAASRGIDQALGQRFFKDATANTVRYYTTSEYDDYELPVDPLAALTSVAVDRDGNGTYEETWVRDTDFVLEPLNAPADGKPWTKIRILRSSTTFGLLPCYEYANAIKVTAQFGWPAVPPQIKELTTLVAARLVKRTREAPFGIVSFGMDGAAVRASQFATDPEYNFLTAGFSRRKLLV